MKKKFLALLCFIMLTISLVGCAEVVNSERQEVDVVIVDSYHRGAWLQPMYNGKFTTYITHPAVYQITVTYNDIEYTISSQALYNTYKNRIGQTVTGILEIKQYDNGRVTQEIADLIG